MDKIKPASAEVSNMMWGKIRKLNYTEKRSQELEVGDFSIVCLQLA